MERTVSTRNTYLFEVRGTNRYYHVTTDIDQRMMDHYIYRGAINEGNMDTFSFGITAKKNVVRQATWKQLDLRELREKGVLIECPETPPEDADYICSRCLNDTGGRCQNSRRRETMYIFPIHNPGKPIIIEK